MRRTTDWRAQFDRNPMLMMGVALGGGLLLGTMYGGSSREQPVFVVLFGKKLRNRRM